MGLFQLAGAQEPLVDIVVFSFDRPLQLWSLLESMEAKMSGSGQVVVITRVSSARYMNAYQKVEQRFPWATLAYQQGGDFKYKVLSTLQQTSASYFLFAVDDILVTRFVNLSACARAIEHYKAFGFYLRLGRHITQCYSLNLETPTPALEVPAQGFCRWRFDQGLGDWGFPASVDMTVWRKKDIMPILERCFFDNPTRLEAVLETLPKTLYGLCFDDAKIVNLPLNLVNEIAPGNRYMHAYTAHELLEKFEQGYVFDRTPLDHIVQKSPHMEYIPSFVERKG